MIVQWCIKGISGEPGDGIDEEDARDIINREGIECNWLRNVSYPPSHSEIQAKLTETHLYWHVHGYDKTFPGSNMPFGEETPFISLSAGCVDRDVYRAQNVVHPARLTALEFATGMGAHPGFLFHCWVIVGPKPAVEVGALAEEIRDLNANRWYSPFYPEGEIAAKIRVPAVQISHCERYDPGEGEFSFHRPISIYRNSDFVSPDRVSNVRDVL